VTIAFNWSDCNLFAAWVWSWLGQALFYGTMLAGLTWLITRVLGRRVPAAVHVALWSLVLVKFLTPSGPVWSHSLASLSAGISRTTIERVPAGITGDDAPPPVEGSAFPAFDGRSIDAQALRPVPDWRTLFVAAYVALLVGLSVGRTRSYLVFCARCRAFPSADVATRRLVTTICRRLGVRRIPMTRISDEPPAPFVMGLFRTSLVLTRSQLVRPDVLETVIVHEIAHLRRGDVFVRLLQRIAGMFLFFWPVVGWVNRRIDEAREHACDQWALRHGKLTAGEYARCLLNALQPTRASRLAYRPACMATHPRTIERRIDVILESATRSRSPRAWGVPSLALLAVWSGFVLSGAAAADPAKSQNKDWPATEEAVKEHAIQLYNLVAARDAADFDSDGVLSYREKSAYLIALAMQDTEKFMEEFPYADRDHSGRLDYLEVYGVIRGITLIAYADRRPTAAQGTELDLEFYHAALDAQQWLLDNVTIEPSAAELENIKAVVGRIENPRSDHVRKLNWGGPERSRKGHTALPEERHRFAELEANIATLESKLAAETDAKKIVKLQAMLEKLEALLARLESS